jgi:hypothetical protein
MTISDTLPDERGRPGAMECGIETILVKEQFPRSISSKSLQARRLQLTKPQRMPESVA